MAKKAPWGYGGGFADPDGHVWSVLCLADQR
jgi:predicted lactoylglutathione lyase